MWRARVEGAGCPRVGVATDLEQEARIDTDLDTLAVALYVTADELLKAHPERLPLRPKVGFAPRISDAEIVTLSVMQALLGYTSETRWIRFATARLASMFPNLPGQSGYNKRLRKLAAAGTLQWIGGVLAQSVSIADDTVWVADSTPVECARSHETVKRSRLAEWAQYGYCASHSRYFWGLRLHLAAHPHPRTSVDPGLSTPSCKTKQPAKAGC